MIVKIMREVIHFRLMSRVHADLSKENQSGLRHVLPEQRRDRSAPSTAPPEEDFETLWKKAAEVDKKKEQERQQFKE